MIREPDLFPKILVVEDDPFYQKYIGRGLGQYEVTIAADREAAKEKILGQEFDVIILDKRLRGIGSDDTDGLDVAQYVRDLGKKTPLILLSGYPTEPEQIARLNALGFFSILDKSDEGQFKQLRTAVANALETESRQTLSEESD